MEKGEGVAQTPRIGLGCWGNMVRREPKWCSATDEVDPLGEGWEDIEDEPEIEPGDARPPSEPMSEGAGVTGGESGMLGMGWSLKQADS